MTNRTAWAATFDDLLMKRETPRTDCPKKLPDIPDPTPQDFERFKNMKLSRGRKRSIREWCYFVDRNNPECGSWVKDLFDLGQFHKEMEQKYFEKYVKNVIDEQEFLIDK